MYHARFLALETTTRVLVHFEKASGVEGLVDVWCTATWDG